MTIQNFLDWLDQYQLFTAGYFIALMLLTLLAVTIVDNDNFERLKYFLTALVYGVTIPGICSSLLALYALFIIKTSLLEVGIVTYFLPIVSMVFSLIDMNRKIPMSRIPGFDRLSSLMILSGVTFVIVFILQKTFFGIFFTGGIATLVISFVILFVVLKTVWVRLTK